MGEGKGEGKGEDREIVSDDPSTPVWFMLRALSCSELR